MTVKTFIMLQNNSINFFFFWTFQLSKNPEKSITFLQKYYQHNCFQNW